MARGLAIGVPELMAATTRDSALCFTVVMIDLDGFKRVNDTLGTQPETASWSPSPTVVEKRVEETR